MAPAGTQCPRPDRGYPRLSLALGGDDADTPFMGGQAGDTPGYLRASDAERDLAVHALRQEFVEGRLSHETFMFRMSSALDARNRAQLAGLFTDLPPRPPTLLARLQAAFLRRDFDPGGVAGNRPPGPYAASGRAGP